MGENDLPGSDYRAGSDPAGGTDPAHAGVMNGIDSAASGFAAGGGAVNWREILYIYLRMVSVAVSVAALMVTVTFRLRGALK